MRQRRLEQVRVREGIVALGVGLVASFLFGCVQDGLGGIDRKLQRMLRERSQQIGGQVLASEREFMDPEDVSRDGVYEREVPTVNPAADELRYTPADEARDVQSRLRAYADQARGIDDPGSVLELDLPGAWEQAQKGATEFLTEEEEYILAGIRLLIQRHLFSPRFFNDTTVEFFGDADDGDVQSALRVINDLRVTKQLETGGEVSAQWIFRATEQLRDVATRDYESSSNLVLSADIPLLRGAGRVASESLTQAERDLIYAAREFERFRREFLVSIANDYFSLLESQARIVNQEVQIDSLRGLVGQTEELADAGRVAQFEVNIARNRLQSSEATLASLRESYILELDRFKVRIGIPVTTPVGIQPLQLTLPDPETDLYEATTAGLAYRLDLQNRRDQLTDRRRAVANARNELLPDLDFSGNIGLVTDPDVRDAGIALDPDDFNYTAGITFGLPLDREIERLELRQSVIQYTRAEREFDVFRDQVVLDIRRSVRAVELARFQLDLAQQQVEINESRLEEQITRQDEIDAQTRVDTEIDLLEARDARDQAITDLRSAILDYLLTTDQLRVDRDGTLQRLPGMTTEGAQELKTLEDEPEEGGTEPDD